MDEPHRTFVFLVGPGNTHTTHSTIYIQGTSIENPGPCPGMGLFFRRVPQNSFRRYHNEENSALPRWVGAFEGETPGNSVQPTRLAWIEIVLSHWGRAFFRESPARTPGGNL